MPATPAMSKPEMMVVRSLKNLASNGLKAIITIIDIEGMETRNSMEERE